MHPLKSLLSQLCGQIASQRFPQTPEPVGLSAFAEGLCACSGLLLTLSQAVFYPASCLSCLFLLVQSLKGSQRGGKKGVLWREAARVRDCGERLHRSQATKQVAYVAGTHCQQQRRRPPPGKGLRHRLNRPYSL